MVWYSHLFKSFPQFVMICTVRGFSVDNETEVDVFLEFPCFFDDPANVGNLIPVSSAFSKPLNIWMFSVHILLKSSLKYIIFNIMPKSVLFCFFFLSFIRKVNQIGMHLCHRFMTLGCSSCSLVKNSFDSSLIIRAIFFPVD